MLHSFSIKLLLDASYRGCPNAYYSCTILPGLILDRVTVVYPSYGYLYNLDEQDQPPALPYCIKGSSTIITAANMIFLYFKTYFVQKTKPYYSYYFGKFHPIMFPTFPLTKANKLQKIFWKYFTLEIRTVDFACQNEYFQCIVEKVPYDSKKLTPQQPEKQLDNNANNVGETFQ